MRSFKRLCEVIDTINPDLYGEEQELIQKVIDELYSTDGVHWTQWQKLTQMAAEHQSPHIRELTEQALKYHKLSEDEGLTLEELEEASL